MAEQSETTHTDTERLNWLESKDAKGRYNAKSIGCDPSCDKPFNIRHPERDVEFATLREAIDYVIEIEAPTKGTVKA